MMKNKFYNKARKQENINKKLKKYYDAIESEDIKTILDKMPKNQETLDIIEGELSEFIKKIEGDSDTEKWGDFMSRVRRLEKIIKSK